MNDPIGNDDRFDQRTASISEVEWLRNQIGVFQRRLQQVAPPATTPPPPAPVSVAPPPPWRQPDQHRRARPRLSLPAIEPILKWSGLILMFFSALFLVSTAIQRGWIGPELQLAGAAAIGASLIVGGLVIGRRRSGWDVPLVAVGLATVSATATAGWQWLGLWSHEPWVIASFIVLGLSVGLSRRLTSPGVGGTGLVATVLSLGLLGSSVTEVAILVALAVVVVEMSSAWQWSASLHLITVAAGLVAFGVIAIVAAVDGSSVLAPGAVTTAVFWAMPVVLAGRGVRPSRAGIDWRPTVDRLVMPLPVLFTTAWALTAGFDPARSGYRFLAVGGIALVSAGLVMATERVRLSIWVTQLMGGAAAITVGTTLLFDGPAQLVGLAAQTAALVFFVHLVPDRWASIQAGFMAAITGMIALAGMMQAVETDAPPVDDLVHLGIVAACGVWAWWELRTRTDLGRGLAAICFGGAVLWPVSALQHLPQGQALLSAAWATIGFSVLALAFARLSPRLAQVSLATLAVVMVKLLTVDLEAVDTFWRVALFFVLGGVFLVAGFRVGSALRLLERSGTESTTEGGEPGPGADPGQDNGLAFQK